MKQAWVIARRELRSYFDHPTAYILVIAFLALGLFLAFRSILIGRIATLRPLFDLLPWLIALFVPAMTMRSFAEERRSHTLEWLTAQPLRQVELVMGKFIGNLMFVLIALAGTVPTGLGILLASEADPGIMFAQYAGASLLAAQAVAIGLWASSVTRNQITSFILAAAVSVTLVFLGLNVVTVGLPPVLAGLATQLSVLGHFENIARGVIDLRDVLYFTSVGALFLVLAGFSLSRERLSRQRAEFRRLRLGVVLTAAVVLVLNMLGGRIHGRLDLTRDRLYTLSDGMRTLVRDVPDIVQVKLFVSDALPAEIQPVLRDVRDLLADLRRASRGNLRVIEADPERDEAVASDAQSLGISPTTFNVLRSSEFQVKRGWLGLAVLHAGDQRVIPLVDRTDDLEYRLASYIAAMTRTSKPAIAFLTGNGVRAAYEFQALQGALREQYDIRFVDLQNDSSVFTPDSVRAVFVAAPTQPLEGPALDRLSAYVNAGGSGLLLVENAQLNPQYPQAMPVTSGLESLIESRGVRLKEGMVFDARAHANVMVGRQGPFSVVSGYPLWPVAQRTGDHATTRGLENINLAWASALEIVDSARVHPLWETTDQGGTRSLEMPVMPSMMESGAGPVSGVQVTAVAIDAAGTSGRLIVVGDADFLTDRFVQENPQNGIFAANALDWLAQDEVLIGIRSKHRTPPALVFASAGGAGLLKWGNLLGVPLVFAAFGALRIGRRAGRARSKWEAAR